MDTKHPGICIFGRISASIIEVDNKPAMLAIRSACITSNLRHMKPRHWYCRLLYQQRKVIFAWVTTNELLADALTKPVGPKDLRDIHKAVGR